MSGKTIEQVGDGCVRVSGDVSLEELYAAIPDRELYVEPLSAKRPLSEFLAEGGLGFGSLRHGTFGGQLCRIRSSYDEVEFSYGLGSMPLYNVGYPLQRIMEGRGTQLLKGRFDSASEMILRTRKRPAVALEHLPCETCELPSADGAEDLFFVNEAAAEAMGISGPGVVKARASEGAAPAEEWSKRFLLDKLPEGHEPLTVLTQRSCADSLYEAHRGAAANGFFLGLAVHLGVLVLASVPAGRAEELWKKTSEFPLTWRIGETG